MAVQRLLIVADAAPADADELPDRVRAMIGEAGDIYVVTPTLPGRLDWLAWELLPSRHAADERLDAVLGQVHAIGVDAGGSIGDDSIMTAFADAVEAFDPDHIVIALRSPEHANWQERGLIRHVRERFGLPVTCFELDPLGHLTPAGPSPDR